MHRYAVTIHWSDEDAVFIATAPDLPGCLAHGDTRGCGGRGDRATLADVPAVRAAGRPT